MVNKGQTVVTGINPKTNKKESFYYKSRNSTKNWDNGQVKVAKLKKKGYTKIRHVFPTLLSDLFSI